jgi:hypothetical protein
MFHVQSQSLPTDRFRRDTEYGWARLEIDVVFGAQSVRTLTAPHQPLSARRGTRRATPRHTGIVFARSGTPRGTQRFLECISSSNGGGPGWSQPSRWTHDTIGLVRGCGAVHALVLARRLAVVLVHGHAGHGARARQLLCLE